LAMLTVGGSDPLENNQSVMFKNIKKLLFPRKQEALGFQGYFDSAELPIVQLSQDGKPYYFIIDSGSNYNVIDSNALDSIKHHDFEENTSMYGVNGVTQKVNACVIRLRHEENEFIDFFLKSDLSLAFDQIRKESGVQVSGLIGVHFLHKYQCVIDFTTLITYYKKHLTKQVSQ